MPLTDSIPIYALNGTHTHPPMGSQGSTSEGSCVDSLPRPRGALSAVVPRAGTVVDAVLGVPTAEGAHAGEPGTHRFAGRNCEDGCEEESESLDHL